MDYQYYKSVMLKMLGEKRYRHSINVADRALKLAKIYGYDQEKAYVAGLLHDICKDMPYPEQLKWIKKSDIISDSTIFKQPNVWHSIAGSIFVKEEMGIQDQDIITAIRYHTTGRPNMSSLEKIIYVSDLTSEDRNFDGVEELRKMAEIDLEDAVREILSFIMSDLARRRVYIVEDTYLAYNKYMETVIEI